MNSNDCYELGRINSAHHGLFTKVLDDLADGLLCTSMTAVSTSFKELFNCKTRMPGTVKCRSTVAY